MRHLKRLAIHVACWYSVVAFTTWKANPGTWDAEGRLIVLMLLLLLLGYLIHTGVAEECEDE